MVKETISLLLALFSILLISAQDPNVQHVIKKSGKLKVTGYMQPQWQIGEEAASLQVGKQKQDDEKDELFNRVGIRRGRIKFFYDDGSLGSGGFQFNVTDKPGLEGAQVQIKELYLNVKAPWNKESSFQAGIFNRPFGFEVNYSSSSIESPERSRITTSLLPDECDLGGMIVLTPGANSPFHFLTLQGGFFAGNGINPETDNRKDFIGQLVASKSIGEVHMGLGVSYYNGGVFQTNDSVYTINGNAFSLDVDAANKGEYSKREYIGFDAQLKLRSSLGLTQLRGEYIFGTQPGTSSSSCSPNRSKLPIPEDTYIRLFSGGYVMLTHDIGKSPFSAVLKYEIYDPNSSVSGDDIGTNGSFTGKADIKYHTLGAGVYWQITPDIRTTLYYDMNSNETSSRLSSTNSINNYSSDRNDNVLTMRVQYKF